MSIRFWVLVLVAAITAGILTVVWMTWDTGEKRRVVPPSQTEVKKESVPPLLSEADVDISAEGIELTQGESGQLEWKLKAARGDYNQESGRIMLSRPDMVYFLGEERTRVRVAAGEGSVAQEEDIVELEHNVTAEYDAFTVYSETLAYVGGNRSLHLGGRVLVVRPGMRFNASEVDVDVSTRDVFAHGGVVAEIEDEMFQKEAPVGDNASAANMTVAVNATSASEDVNTTVVGRKRPVQPIMSLEGLFPSKNKRSAPRKKSLQELAVPKSPGRPEDGNSGEPAGMNVQ